MSQNPLQISQQTKLESAIDPVNSYFVIDMLDPVSGKYITYKVTPTQLGALIQSMSKSCCTFTVKTTLTSAQILNLNTTPVVLVPPTGTGTFIQPVCFVFAYTFGTTAYNTNTFVSVNNNGNTNIQYTNVSIIADTQNAIQSFPTGSASGDGSISTIENQSLIATNLTGNPSGGDGTLVIYTVFKVITA